MISKVRKLWYVRLSLWAGPPLAGAPGQHAEAAAALHGPVARHPLRERFSELLLRVGQAGGNAVGVRWVARQGKAPPHALGSRRRLPNCLRLAHVHRP